MGFDLLTPSERTVMRLAEEGFSVRRIAERLSISVNTVESHLRKIYERVGPHPDDTSPAAAAALRRPERT